ncbi:MAG: D-alanyl-D-alanine carboxypeptidase/D-alanyl-D-alanine endopeptidase [Candidatus Tyrphobacter sp.]
MRTLRGFCAIAACAALLAAAPSPQRGTDRLREAIGHLITRPQYTRGFFGIAVYDLDDARTIYALNARRLFVPASTTKTLTEGTALGVLGPNFRFTTPVYRTGPVNDGVLDGDLVVVASGDPDISQRIQPNGTLAFENQDHAYDGSPETKAVPGDPVAVLRDLARQVAARGIRRVTGRVVVDASLFPDGGAEGGTGTEIDPMILNDNLVDVIIAPGARVGDPATVVSISPQTPYARFVDTATTAGAHVDDTLAMNDAGDGHGGKIVTISGTVKVTDKPTLYAYRVSNPPRFAEDAFSLALRDAGVAIADPPVDAPFDRAAYAASYTPANLVAQHVSPPLSEDVKVTLKVSDNLHAAEMPYLLGVYGAHATHDQLQAGFDVEAAFLRRAGLDLSGAAQSDGEGANDWFAPEFIVKYLAWVRRQPWYGDFYGSLPIMGVDGTLADVERHAPGRGRVHAKTGTWAWGNLLSHGAIYSKGLAGYVTTRSGHHIAFCLYVNTIPIAHDADGEAILGGLLGAIANAIYLYG